MRGLQALCKTGFDTGGWRDRRAVDLLRALLQILGCDEFLHRDFDEVRITEIFGAIGKHALFDLGDQMHVSRG